MLGISSRPCLTLRPWQVWPTMLFMGNCFRAIGNSKPLIDFPFQLEILDAQSVVKVCARGYLYALDVSVHIIVLSVAKEPLGKQDTRNPAGNFGILLQQGARLLLRWRSLFQKLLGIRKRGRFSWRRALSHLAMSSICEEHLLSRFTCHVSFPLGSPS